MAELLRAGIKATINSDDPAYFGGYLNQNFVETFAALPALGAQAPGGEGQGRERNQGRDRGDGGDALQPRATDDAV